MTKRLLRPAEVASRLGISIPTLYRRMKQPDFPRKIRISPGATGFYEHEVNEWMDQKQAQFQPSE